MAISDQHGALPDIPQCDLLVVAGDNCPDFPSMKEERRATGPDRSAQRAWFEDVWKPWRDRQPAKRCLLTWGNHDYYGEALHTLSGHRVGICSRDNVNVLSWEPETIAVVDGLVTDDSGLRVWLTPWSSQFKDWAFIREEYRLAETYGAIPADIDILVSHQPPLGYGDAMFHNLATGQAEHLGSTALLDAIRRVRPTVVICGHMHSGHGKYEIEHRTAIGSAKTRTTVLYNVAVLNEKYEHVHAPTVIDL